MCFLPRHWGSIEGKVEPLPSSRKATTTGDIGKNFKSANCVVQPWIAEKCVHCASSEESACIGPTILPQWRGKKYICFCLAIWVV